MFSETSIDKVPNCMQNESGQAAKLHRMLYLFTSLSPTPVYRNVSAGH
jgi:hypothetical protein